MGLAQEGTVADIRAHERIGTDRQSPWWWEHRARYHFAAEIVEDSVVLDIACGTGYGGPILLEAGADRVVGVDLSWESLSLAKGELTSGLSLCQADGTSMPIRSASIDVATCFETLEHVVDSPALIRELRRVLQPKGTLILSTPNAFHTRPVDGNPRNPFHVREFYPEELTELLGQHFSTVFLLGQKTHPRYGISPYWELSEQLPRSVWGRARVLSWKLQNRLPFRLKNDLSRLIHRRPFYPC
jgi:2-polyprenyl-3-methyl-5-hydroxy-6-metoxy-1,4-benzoquinol methylase